MMQQHAVSWFEIPVTDFERAKQFYETIFQIEMPINEMNGYKMGFFPTLGNSAIGGAICFGEGYIPSGAGSLIYLNANPNIDEVLNRIHDHGGRLLTPKTLIGEGMGYYAIFVDTENNRLALHSND
jgi:uncharacterized protein